MNTRTIKREEEYNSFVLPLPPPTPGRARERQAEKNLGVTPSACRFLVTKATEKHGLGRWRSMHLSVSGKEALFHTVTQDPG